MTLNQAIRKSLLFTPQSLSTLHFRVDRARGVETSLETFGPEFRKWKRKYPDDFAAVEAKTKQGRTYYKYAKK